MKPILIILLLALLQSCLSQKEHVRRNFSYKDDMGVSRDIPVIVPKGYTRQEIRLLDNGILEQVYHYRNGSLMFFAYMPRGGDYLPIDTAYHIPQPQYQGGIFYKGTGIGEYWWREAQINALRVGYTKVPSDYEWRFDSAVNYVRFR